MSQFRLGELLGVEIRIDPSWLIVFLLILWTFSFGVFPRSDPGLGTAVYLAMGASATLLFFASILAHELAHAQVARRKGIPVDRITLFIFGGMAHTRMEFEEPVDEFQVAGVGPLASLIIGVGFAGVAWGADGAGLAPPVGAVAGYLARLNVILALFNLFPGFPLDGGRLLRAAVWKYTGDLTRATRIAATGGRVLGLLLMALGVLQLVAGGVVGGVWMILIGWFVRSAADASWMQHLLRRSLTGLRAAEVMTPYPRRVPADATVQTLMDEVVRRSRFGAYPVVDGAAPVGVVTLERLRTVPREQWAERTARDVMEPAATVEADESMERVLERLQGPGPERLLVVREGALEGVLTRNDIGRWLERSRHLPDETAP